MLVMFVEDSGYSTPTVVKTLNPKLLEESNLGLGFRASTVKHPGPKQDMSLPALGKPTECVTSYTNAPKLVRASLKNWLFASCLSLRT